MNKTLIETVVHAVLYEGHIVYPYRAGVQANRLPFVSGRVYPEAFSASEHGAEPCVMQTQCVIEGPASATLAVTFRFLQPMERDIGALAAPLPKMPAADNPDFFHVVPELEIEGATYRSWTEVVERTIESPRLTLTALCEQPRQIPYSLIASRSIEPILDHRQHIAGVIVRRQESLEGLLEVSAEPVGASAFRVTARITNRSRVPADALDDCEEIVMWTFASTHAILQTQGGKFISLIDPPEAYQAAATACRNIGAWPVLIGDEDEREQDTILASPIVLGDYPGIGGDDAEEMLPLPEMVDTAEEGRETQPRAPRHAGSRGAAVPANVLGMDAVEPSEGE